MQLTHTHKKWLQILAQRRFSTETPLGRERRLQIQRERWRRRLQETTEQKEHRLAQRRQRRQQETDEQEIGIRGIISSVLRPEE